MCVDAGRHTAFPITATSYVDLQSTPASFSHRDWEKEQMTEPASRVTVTYLTANRPTPFPLSLLKPVGSHAAPPSVDEELDLVKEVRPIFFQRRSILAGPKESNRADPAP